MHTFPTTEVAVSDLQPNRWNPNKQSTFMFEREKESIHEFGFVDPITVREVDGKLEIVDGEHRWKAAKELGLEKVTITNLGKVSRARAMALTDLLNNLRGNSDAFRQAEMIQAILEEEPDLKSALPYTEAQLSQFIDDVDWDGLDQADRNPPDPKPKDSHVTLNVPLLAAQHETVKEAMELAKAKLSSEEKGDAAALVFIAERFLRQAKRKKR